MFDYQPVYVLEFDDLAGRVCRAELWEYRDATTAIMPIYLNGGERPAVLKNINNSNTIYSPIRGTELSLEIVSSSFGLATFYSSNDFKWRCDFYIDNSLWFKGYLSQEDSYEEYVDYNHAIKLKFTDNLGILKDIELKKPDGSDYYETDTFFNIVYNCLYQTRLSLPIHIACNVFPSDTTDVTDESGLNITKVNTRTWLKSKGEFLDCYKVLSDILLAWGCVLYQYRGQWWIDKWGDRLDVSGQLKTFDYSDINNPLYNSAYVETAEIGMDIKEVETPITLSVSPPSKFARVYYKYNVLPNFIRNINFDEGTYNANLSQQVEDDDPSRANWYAYDPTFLTLTQVGGTPEAYILSGNGRLVGEQYLVIKNVTGADLPIGKISFEPFYAYVGDIIKVSFQASHNQAIISSEYNFVAEVKVGDKYVKRKEFTEDTYVLTKDYTALFFNVTDDLVSINDPQPKQWHNISFEFSIPLLTGTSGVILNQQFLEEVTISLTTHARINGINPGDETWIKDVNVTIDLGPAIGNYDEYPISSDIRKEFDFEVAIGESERSVISGAIFDQDGITPTNSWKRGNLIESLSFKQILISEYFKFMQRPRLTVEGVFRGTMFETADINDTYKPIGHFPVYYISALPNKKFALVSINEMDFRSLVWRGTLVELTDSTVDEYLNVLPDTHVFKLLYK